jgi:hypothetical protein
MTGQPMIVWSRGQHRERRPTRVIVAAANKNVDIDTTYVFSEADGGTRLVVTTDVKPKGSRRSSHRSSG